MKGNVIVITSGKGGVGKTTATASIGAALAVKGNKVAVVDMDIGLRNLDVVMGLENRIVFNVVDAVKGRCKPSQAAIKDRRIDNLFLIPASQSDTKNAMAAEEVRVKQLGSAASAQTKVIVGTNPKILQQIKQIEEIQT